MTTLAVLLQSRRDDAKRRAEAARREAAKAEDELRKWEDALVLELGSPGSDAGSGVQVEVDTPKSEDRAKAARFRLEVEPNKHLPARMKHDIFRNAIVHAERPPKTSELRKLLEEALSERYVYYLVATFKKSGELEENEDGGLIWKGNVNGHKPNGSAAKSRTA